MKTLLGVIALALLSCSLRAQSTNTAATTRQQKDTLKYKAGEVKIEAERSRSAATDREFRSQDMALMPHTSSQDLLRIVPGLVLAQHAGGGKAEQIFLRGFDCDHGTDINISVDGAPVNMVSHGHGQGYADMHFLIPETVENISVVKGPYFASYGDQATAGAVVFHTADTLKNNLLKVEGGMFNTWRAVALAGSSLSNSAQATKVYAGAELFGSRGYFDAPQDFRRMNLLAKSYSQLSAQTSLTTSLMYFSSDWNASGQIPDRAVAEGLISRFGSIDPNEGGTTGRTTLQLALQSKGESPFSLKASYSSYRFHLFSNFTFFALDSVRGDMIEQNDLRSIYALTAKKDWLTLWGETVLQTEVGVNLRYDDIRVGLFHDSARVRLATVQDAIVQQGNAGIYVEESLVTGNLTMMLGARGDFFGFDVQSLRGEQTDPQGKRQSFLISPKANLMYALNQHATVFLNSGFGFHSNDARVVVSQPGENTLPRAFGSEIGGRWSRDGFAVSAALWMLDLQSELVWVGDEGTTEESGRTRRIGLDLEARYSATSWLTLGADATLSRGHYRDVPEGENFIALAPNLTLTSYAVVRSDDFSAALRLRHIGERPGNESYSLRASGYTLLDLNASLALTSKLQCTIECQNLLNSAWREAQFDTQSRLRNEAAPISEIHYTSGTPFALRLGMEMRF